eukprot:Awhi_evm1s11502
MSLTFDQVGSVLTATDIPPVADNENEKTSDDKVKDLVLQMNTCLNDLQLLIPVVRQLRGLSTIPKSPPLQELIDGGIIPRMVEYLTSDDSTLAFEASWILTNICSGTTAQTKAVVDLNVVPIFVGLLSHKDENLSEQAAWAIGNIAGDSTQFRDLVLNTKGSLEGILNLIKNSTKISVLRNCVWVYSNLCRGKPRPDFDNVKTGIPVMIYVLEHFGHDEELVIDACWAMSYLTDDDGNLRIQVVLDHNVVSIMGPLLGHHNVSIVTPALRTMGNIITGTDQQTQAVLNVGFLNYLIPLLDNGKESIKKEAFWSISNVTAGNGAQVTSVIESGLLQLTMEKFSQQTANVQKEMIWVLVNATACSAVWKIVFETGILPFLFKLKVLEDDVVLGKLVLEGIENLVKHLSISERVPFLDDYNHMDATVCPDLRFESCFYKVAELFGTVSSMPIPTGPTVQTVGQVEKLKSNTFGLEKISLEKISTPMCSLEKISTISTIPPKSYNALSFELGSVNVDNLEKSTSKSKFLTTIDLEKEGKNTRGHNKCSCLKLSFLFLFVFLFLMTIFMIVFVQETGSLPSHAFSKLFHL